LAYLRQDDTTEAGRILSGVLEEHPRHVGARLGMMMIRSEDPLWSTPDSELIANLSRELDSGPTDSGFDRLFLLSVGLLRTEADADSVVEVLEMVERFCEEKAFAGLSADQRRTLMLIVVLTGLESEQPAVREALRRLLAIDVIGTELASHPGMVEFVCAGGLPYPGCSGWTPDPYEGDPAVYFWFHSDRGDPSLLEPDALLALASEDPRLDRTVADWVLFLGDEGPIEKILAWSKGNRTSGSELGRQYLSEGIVLNRHGHFDRAEESYAAAGEILGDDATLKRFRGANLMATDRLDEAIDLLEGTDASELPLALAGVGRLREAYRHLAPAESTVSDGETEPVTEDQGPVATLTRALTDWIRGTTRSADTVNLARFMDSMAREIENDEVVGAAVFRRLRCEIVDAAASALIDMHRGFRFEKDEGIQWTTSVGPSVPYALPRDPLELLAFLETLPQSEAGTDDSVTHEDVADFARHLSGVLRDEIERLDPATAGR
jgi:hypothetical protein